MPITHHSPFLYPLAHFINIGGEGGGGLGEQYPSRGIIPQINILGLMGLFLKA